MDCYKTSDNKHFGCPSRMADGRHFTDYRPHCYVDNLIIAENGINNSHATKIAVHHVNKEMEPWYLKLINLCVTKVHVDL
jgi:hypothetical protein